MRCVGRVARIGEMGSMYVVGKAEVKGQLGRRWGKRLDGVAVGGVCVYVLLYVCMFVPKDTCAYAWKLWRL